MSAVCDYSHRLSPPLRTGYAQAFIFRHGRVFSILNSTRKRTFLPIFQENVSFRFSRLSDTLSSARRASTQANPLRRARRNEYRGNSSVRTCQHRKHQLGIRSWSGPVRSFPRGGRGRLSNELRELRPSLETWLVETSAAQINVNHLLALFVPARLKDCLVFDTYSGICKSQPSRVHTSAKSSCSPPLIRRGTRVVARACADKINCDNLQPQYSRGRRRSQSLRDSFIPRQVPRFRCTRGGCNAQRIRIPSISPRALLSSR